MSIKEPSLPAELVDRAIYRRGTLAVYDRIVPQRTALLALDMQNVWLRPGAPFHTPNTIDTLVPINRLARALRAKGGTVCWFQQTTGAPGTPEYWAQYFDNFVGDQYRGEAVAALTPGNALHALHDALDRAPQDLVLPKYRFSAFIRNPSDPERMLRERGIDTVIVAGTATNIGCESTVRDAMMLDFNTFMPHDATIAPYYDGHLAGMRSVMQAFADVRGVDEIVTLINAG
ncbi:cysteine hydrolase [Solimonas marina]|uniref:Cysteine hydrolase n=1 Tax=Solimonas marina TaxID=2714601 RepID=A0A969WD36_9GAMM|nr:cysteine hydrolase [Solimonas marina]NKF22605.1 cysteine hydrolase [Solimonas marina]